MFVAAILLFVNLDNQYLWQDEAETAVLAKRVLEFGYPRAYDGKNLINPTIRTGLSADYGWRYHPWGQFYIAAASFKLFGTNTFTARLPFAVLGLINILLIYLLARRMTGNYLVANLAAFLTAFSVPYILLMRQCRYYAPAVFLVLIALLFYLRFLKKGRMLDLAVFSGALAALGYTVHGMFVPVFCAIGLHYLIFSFNKKTVFPVIFAGIIVAMTVLPWFLYSNSAKHVVLTLEKIGDNLEFDLRMINKYIFPAVFFAAVYAIRAIWRRNFTLKIAPEEKQSLLLIGMVVLASLAAFSVAEERNFRYLVYFIPLFAVVQGMVLLRLERFNKALLAGFLAISVGTGIFNMGYPNWFFPKYLYEITHDYDGPTEGIVKFLKEHARAGDTVKIIYGDLPLMFYTDLKVDNSWVYDDAHMPEFIVFRHGWHELLDNTYYTKVKNSGNYKEHILDYPDIKWDNRPDDLTYHRFRTDKEAPRVVLFERIRE